uniref:Chromosome partition protein Smc n=1 Tax=Desulfacinum infernum TaxID=35837 RepID=A0A832EJX8_9BACT
MTAVTDLIRRLEGTSPDIQDIRTAVLFILQQWETLKHHEDLAKKLTELTDAVGQLAKAQSRIDDTLLELAKAQKRTEESLEKLTVRVDQLTERVDRLTERVDRLTERVDQLTLRLDQLTERVDRLTERVDQLAQAQKRTEERVNQLTEAQKRTEERISQLTEAQKRTEHVLQDLIKEFKGFKKTLGGITNAVGYGLEDRIIALIPAFAAREYDLQVKSALRRFMEYPDGRSDELNIYAEGHRQGKPVALVGECRSQPGKGDLREFARKVERLRQHLGIEVEPFLVGYSITPDVARYAAAEYPHIKLFWSYQFEVLRESSR